MAPITGFLGEIRIVSFGFPPPGWAFCDGQELSVAQNGPLFSLLGRTYGGDGVTTFNLPDLRGRAPLHFGAGILRGDTGGTAWHTLNLDETPAHTHPVHASDAAPNTPLPTGSTWPAVVNGYASWADAPMNPAVLGTVGGQQHENRQPYLVLKFVIALTGEYPMRH